MIFSDKLINCPPGTIARAMKPATTPMMISPTMLPNSVCS
jgi:hypothetical protein